MSGQGGRFFLGAVSGHTDGSVGGTILHSEMLRFVLQLLPLRILPDE